MAITITCVNSSASRGVAYSDTFIASGGVAPYTWFIDSGSLPPGLALDSATGIVSGTPLSYGVFNYTVEADDSGVDSATQSCSITVPATPSGRTASAIEVNTLTESFVLSDMGPFSKSSKRFAMAQYVHAPYHVRNFGTYDSTALTYGSWSAEDILNQPTIQQFQNGADGPYGNLVYFVSIGSGGNLELYSFNLATLAYAIIALGGPAPGNFTDLLLNKLSNGDFVATYSINDLAIYSVVYSAGAWGTPVLAESVSSGSGLLRFVATGKDSADNVHISYQKLTFSGSIFEVRHAKFTAGLFGAIQSAYNSAGNNFDMGKGQYINSADQFVFPVVQDSSLFLVVVSNATGIVTYANETVFSPGTDFFGFDHPRFLYAPDGSWITVAISQPNTALGPWFRYSYFIKPPGGSWTTSDATIWDGSVDASDPVSIGGEPPCSIRLLSDGVTIGVAFPQVASTPSTGAPTCGVVYYVEAAFGIPVIVTGRKKKFGRYWKAFRGRAG